MLDTLYFEPLKDTLALTPEKIRCGCGCHQPLKSVLGGNHFVFDGVAVNKKCYERLTKPVAK